MVVKAKAPTESADAKASRERAEAAAEKREIDETRRGVTQETAALLRRFGIRAAMTGAPGATGGVAGFGSFGGSSPGGSYNPAAAMAGFGSVFTTRGVSRSRTSESKLR